MPSFDIVSEVDKHEITNTVDNANRELSTRFDFRGVDASFEQTGDSIKVTAEADFQVDQMIDIFYRCCTKRNIDTNALDISDEATHSGKTFYKSVTFKQGIEKDIAKKIVKLIKDSKMKVQASIQGEEVRVTGKKRDDLQQVMALVRQAELGQPFQFKNFRD
ncbi:YajQ family cyclic di-GMP-binding protein [Kangiella sediminilitoris]|uniref:Nucleotide-binding protein KS2013_2035 n=1 Tax=Kangiella sediminilitoris TaxID=1144748 RepID=A0A1B3BD74_9GAMM|nr:YajQ family cyclic di-GMP-binding protein [Kangiella sediminilitoris]AOE50740.1 nucleotide-binding protein [Kangiella sediminilitoris]